MKTVTYSTRALCLIVIGYALYRIVLTPVDIRPQVAAGVAKGALAGVAFIVVTGALPGLAKALIRRLRRRNA